METTKTTTQILGGDYKKWWGKKDRKPKKNSARRRFHETWLLRNFCYWLSLSILYFWFKIDRLNVVKICQFHICPANENIKWCFKEVKLCGYSLQKQRPSTAVICLIFVMATAEHTGLNLNSFPLKLLRPFEYGMQSFGLRFQELAFIYRTLWNFKGFQQVRNKTRNCLS